MGEIPVAVEAELARLRAENARLLKLLRLTYEIDDDTISIGDLVRVPGSGSDFIKDGGTGSVIALGSPYTGSCKRVTRAT